MRAIYLFICSAAILCTTTPQVQAAQQIELEEAIDLAFCNNPSLQEISRRIDEAESHVQRAKAAYLPHVRATASLEGGDAPSLYLFKTIDAGRLAPNTDFNDPGGVTNIEYGLSIEQELFSWGRRRNQVGAAVAGREAVGYQRCDYANQLVGMIVAVYLDSFKARAAYETAERSVELVEKQLDVARKKGEKRLVLKTDVLKLEVRLAEAQERSIRAASAERQANHILASLIGAEQECEFAPMETEDLLGLGDEKVDWDRALDNPRAYAVWAAEAQLKKACREVGVATSASLPTVSLRFRTYADSQDLRIHAHRTNWAAACALNWDLFSGGRIRANKRIARAAQGQMEQRLRHEQHKVREQIATAQLKKREAEERLRVAEVAENQALQAFELLELQYERGTASVTSYLEAEQMLAAASLRFRSAYYDLFHAEAELLRVLGLLLERQ